MTRAPALALSGVLLVAACGGGGGGDSIRASGDGPPGDPSFAAGTTATAPLTYMGFQGDGTLRAGTDESVVNLGTGAVSGGIFAGSMTANRTRIDQPGGGTVTLTDPGATEYVRVFRREQAGSAPVFGVVGFLSNPTGLPRSGQISYTGAAEVTAADQARLYTLDGTANIVTDFGRGRVRIVLDGLGGTAEGISSGNTGPVAIPRGGRITVDGSRISGATFSGGAATVAGLPFTVTGGANASGTSGGFFGPRGDEVAGRVVVDDPAGNVRILGTFAAD